MTRSDRASDVLPRMRIDADCPFAHGLTTGPNSERDAAILAGRIWLAPHPAVGLSHPPDWRADPFDDPNWRFQLHSLRWAQALKRAHDDVGGPDRLRRYLEILRDWYARNPWSDPPSDQSWGDHSTAIRTRVYAACAQAMPSPWPQWLRLALEEHVDVLSGSDLYPSGGNHALNQNVGLFAAATMLGREDERRFAVQRTAELLERSVDEQGVTDEQSTEYQVYNFRRYREAAELFRAEGTELPAVFDRIERMPEFIAHATLPNARDVMIGDSHDVRAHRVPGTIAQFSATQGRGGPRPTERIRVFDAGFVFARTGWGKEPLDTDIAHLSLRFGPARIPHGHHDAAAITLAAHGHRIICPAGKYRYTWDAIREYVLSRRAQNTVTFLGRPYGPDGGSELLHATESDSMLVCAVRDHHHPDVDFVRTVAFDLEDGTLVIIDRFVDLDGSPVTAEQRFRLHPAFTTTVDAAQVRATTGEGMTVDVVQISPVDQVRVARGEEDPLDGWVSFDYGNCEPAAVAVTSLTSANGRFVTLVTCTTGEGRPESPRDRVTLDVDGTVRLDGRPIPVG